MMKKTRRKTGAKWKKKIVKVEKKIAAADQWLLLKMEEN